MRLGACALEIGDAFRRARAAAEDAWDWGAAGVTSALTPEMEAAQAAKRAAASAASRSLPLLVTTKLTS